ncbi:MAG: sigma-54-dependent Fis family transcriptional regulator [Fimbriimonadaceae bacterium]|nr:sigma-54-dependent Fis family transcriptional regulator [Fimbriimonadaceae bacterium]
MSKKRILIVDDEVNIRRILQVAFDREGWVAVTAEDAHEALATLEKGGFSAVLTDVTMPGMSGYQLQETIGSQWPELPVVIMTAFGTIPQAVSAIRKGAFEYITKPFDLDHLKRVMQAAMDSTGTPSTKPRAAAKSADPKGRFIYRSEAMAQIDETVQQVADSRASVLITGESGTGKEVVANRIHQLSPRASGPFVAVSCAALPDTLLESELFGFEKGAFTGADNAKAGRFEMADGGTLFLDEIGDIPMLTQIKLLRVLQERTFERLGATAPTKVDVRLVTATNRNLQAQVDAGEFRLDLMYRLRVIEIRLPALRERTEDIVPLAEYFLARASEANDRVLVSVSSEAARALEAYPWPGNVRELENAMEYAVALASRGDEELTVRHLPSDLRSAA